MVVAFDAASADAAKYVHRVVAEGEGTAAGQLKASFSMDTAVNYGSVTDDSVDPLGGSVDGYVYVVDESNHRVQVFDSDGQFEFMWGAGVEDGLGAAQVCDRTELPCTGGVVGTAGGAFRSPQGIAIDQDSGHVFVLERPTTTVGGRIQEFEADGSFVRMWGWDVVIEGTTDDTPTDGFETCFVPADCQAAVLGSSPGQFGSNVSNNVRLDVDQDSGDVFASDPGAFDNQRIQRFVVPADSSVALAPPAVIGSFIEFVPGAGRPNPQHVLVHDGVMYASTAAGGHQVVRYDISTGTFMAPIPVASLTSSSTNAATSGLEIDPSTGNLFVARDDLVGDQRFSPVYELGNPGAASAGAVTLVDTHVAGTNFSWFGLGFDPADGTLYAGGKGDGGNGTPMLLAAGDGPLPEPVVTFGPYTGIGARSASVNFTIGTTGLVPVGYELQLANLGSGTFVTVATGEVEGSAAPVDVSETVSSLRPGTSYRVRVVTSKPFNNPGGPPTEHPTPLLTDFVAPDAIEVRADAVEDDSARLTGRVDPNGLATTYRFEWGHGDYANSIPVPDASIGDGFGFEFVSEQLTGLQPNTGYQFRLVATSAEGTITRTGTFTTLATSTTGRAFELVSPADKYGGQGVGFWPAGLGHLLSSGVAAHKRERFVASSMFGSTLSGDGGFSHANDFVLAERVSDQGWQSAPAITRPNYSPAIGQTAEIAAASDDLSRMFWGSPSTLAFFPELSDGGNPSINRPGWRNLDAGLLSDWGGPLAEPTRWELFGPSHLDQVPDVTSNLGAAWTMIIAGGGTDAYGMTAVAPSGLPLVHGLAGPNDPTWPSPANPNTPGVPAFGDLVSGRSVYHADVSGGLADSFGGTGERDLVNVCTDGGGSRTVLPTVVGGDLEAVACPAGPGGRDRLISSRGAAFTSGGGARANAVSRDGSRVFFIAPDPSATGVPNGISSFCSGTGDATLCPPQLFVRQRNDNGDMVTRWVSKPEAGLLGVQDPSLTGSVRFEGASADGGVVYFRTNSPLTADDPNGACGAPCLAGPLATQSWDLYRYEFADGDDPTGAGATLTRVSSGPDETGDCNSPLPAFSGGADDDSVGALRLASEDGSRAYFTCQAPLPGVPAAGNGTITTPGGTPTTADATNLYLYDATQPAAQRWRFVARLPRAVGASHATCASTGTERRSPFRGETGVNPAISDRSAGSNCVRGTVDGSFITLFTTGRLTTDDPGGTPVDDPPGVPVADIYGYDADSDRLTRITAPQGGSETAYPCLQDRASTPVDESALFACRGDGGADLQMGVGYRASAPYYNLGLAQDGDDRVAFFQSASRLVADDLDDGYDVYQWRDGELSLITSGAPDSEDALFKGNDRSGQNVYFVTRERLSWQDTDVVADIYTARVGGGVDEPPPPGVCLLVLGGCQANDGALSGASVNSTRAGSGNASPGVGRAVLSVSRPGRRAIARAARSGVLKVGVRVNRRGVVRGVARARLVRGGGLRRVGSARVRVSKAGKAMLRLRLSRAAVRRLGSGKRLAVSVRVSFAGTSPKSVRFGLRRAAR